MQNNKIQEREKHIMASRLDSLKAIENVYETEERQERERLLNKMETLKETVENHYLPRFMAAIETLKVIASIEKKRSSHYDVGLFREIRTGKYQKASIRDYNLCIMNNDADFYAALFKNGLSFGQEFCCMAQNNNLYISKDRYSDKTIIGSLESIIEEFPIWEQKVNEYADLIIRTDKDKIEPKEERPYEVRYLVREIVTASNLEEAKAKSSEYLKEHLPNGITIDIFRR